MASRPAQSHQLRPSRSVSSLSTSRTDHSTNHGLRSEEEQVGSASAGGSQELVLNHPGTLRSAPSSQTAPLSTPKADPRHCWICLQDEGENSNMSSDWRSPCPCNLQAHEECLLEWIADLEAPSSNNSEPVTQIFCPQCKAEIKVARPRDYIVTATDSVARFARQLVMPAALSAALGCLYSGLTIYGLNALYLVLGPEDSSRLILQSSSRGWGARRSFGPHQQILLNIIKITDPFLPFVSLQDWYLLLCLPSIGPALILSRTNLADRAFTSLPILYFTFRPENRNLRWPPSPGLAFVSLPYLRLVYKGLYRHIFGDLERQWDLAVQRRPREGETEEEVAQARNARQAENGILDIEVEIINVQEEEDHAEQHPEQDPADGGGPGRRVQAVGAEDEAPLAEPDGAVNPDEQRGGANPAPRVEPWEFRQNISTAQIARTAVGALFFPAISSLMGDLLKYTLPKRWVTPPTRVRFSAEQIQVTGLLQEKWGRSIIGGCLFIVLKDALILYSKWRKAKIQGKRRVLDYVKGRATS